MVRISYIPGALDTLSGKYFPHLVHMQENIASLRKKVEVTLLTADKANARYTKFQKSALHNIINHKTLHIIRKFLNLVFFFAVYAEVKKNIVHRQSDLFLVRFCISNYLITKYLYYRGYKILLEVHALAHVEEKKYGQSSVPPFYFRLIIYLEKRILGWAHQITAVSESLKHSLLTLGVDEDKIHVIPNAVDPKKFDYNADAQSVIKRYNLENRIVIGFVGSFARYHGLEILLDVAENLQKKYEDVIFLVVGRNVHGSDNIMEMILAKKLSRLFAFAGEVPHSKIPSYISAMNIAIIPDFNTYGSPMKLFEYMAMKKAIVAPDVPPIVKVLKHGHTGILFERGNVGQAIKSIERLLEDEQLRYELGEKARFEAISSYTWDKNAEKIAGIAESMT